MYGDFSRDSFDACKNYTRVLMQQGRPLTDADWNEQVSAIWDRIESLARSVIGWHGTTGAGFSIGDDPAVAGGFVLQAGDYSVDGVRCENNRKNRKLALPASPLNGPRVVYLEAWEQSVNGIEDPSILESALRGTDTAVRSKIVWALKYTTAELTFHPNDERQKFLDAVTGAPSDAKPRTLSARLYPVSTSPDPKSPCAAVLSDGPSVPFADRLYRVEIHRGGEPAKRTDGAAEITTKATFKWSRENGSVVTALSPGVPSGTILNVDRTKFSSRVPIRPPVWVELFDVDGRSVNTDQKLLKVKLVSSRQVTVEQSVAVKYDVGQCLIASFESTSSTGYYLRQWDHDGTPLGTAEKVETRIDDRRLPSRSAIVGDGGAAVIVATDADDDVWLELEAGIDVQFSGTWFQQGDYWWIRTTSDGRVIVLPDGGLECAAAARGSHHYAPIGKMTVGVENAVSFNNDFRKPFAGPGVQYPAGLPSECNPCSPTQKQTRPPESRDVDASADAIRPARSDHAAALDCCVNVRPTSLLLSHEGERALRGYLGSPKDVTRRVPARYLKYEPQSGAYRRFRSPLLVSEILEASYEKYLAKVERCIEVTEAERGLVEADARADYSLAAEFQSLVSSGQGFRPLIA